MSIGNKSLAILYSLLTQVAFASRQKKAEKPKRERREDQEKHTFFYRCHGGEKLSFY